MYYLRERLKGKEWKLLIKEKKKEEKRGQKLYRAKPGLNVVIYFYTLSFHSCARFTTYFRWFHGSAAALSKTLKLLARENVYSARARLVKCDETRARARLAWSQFLSIPDEGDRVENSREHYRNQTQIRAVPVALQENKKTRDLEETVISAEYARLRWQMRPRSIYTCRT